ncbi:MAG TPA: rod shape-determining protein MreC [Prolixibacteraceae bacterium]|nr:rod shape-determining protein MreC [Prolixibacteraceae bacterium]
MKNLLNFLLKFHHIILFILLEVICLTFIIKYNNFQRVKFLNSSNAIAGKVYTDLNTVKEFFNLRRQNEMLAAENKTLREELLTIRAANSNVLTIRQLDSSAVKLIPAKVINNSVNKQYNYITLNKGSLQGIRPDMGIICANGVVGVIVNVSQNYSTALSVLNGRLSINAKLLNTNYFGPLKWEGSNPYLAILSEIPYHVKVQENDEVVTSGYSEIFPEGILIGRVVKVGSSKSENFQEIYVQLSTDFNNLYYVDVIQNSMNSERRQLEKMTAYE